MINTGDIAAFLINDYMTPLRALILFFFLSISVVFCSVVLVEEEGNGESELIYFENDAEAAELSGTDADDEAVPGPPGSGIMVNRKRAYSFYISPEEPRNCSKLDPGSFYNQRSESAESDVTLVEDWEGFVKDYGSVTPSRNNSSESTDPVDNLRQMFAFLGKTRSRSFTKGTKRRQSLNSLPESEEEVDVHP